MQSMHVAVLYLIASVCLANDAAQAECADDVADNFDDRCELLQAGIGVVNNHEIGEDHKESDTTQKATQKALAPATPPKEETKRALVAGMGWPGDLLKGITDTLGGADKLEKDFDAIKSAVATFSHDVHQAIKGLTDNVQDDMAIEKVVKEVESTETKIHFAALKLWNAIETATSTFMKTIAKIAPAQFKSAVGSVLEKLTAEAKRFADSFEQASKALKTTVGNSTAICKSVQEHLAAMHHKVEAFIKSATDLSTEGLSKDILKAKDALPDSIKKEVDKLIEKANEAADKLMSSASSTMQEISVGLAQAFKGHCSELQSAAGRLKVSAFSLVAIGMSIFFL